jgi:phosphoribosylglycinamide formyltransferase-1
MPARFVSEPLTPLGGSFDTALMAQGEPGLPHRFRWRGQEWQVAAILEKWKDHGDCRHGSGERYVRKHVYRVQTAEGPVLNIYFQRTFGKSRPGTLSRWWVHTME